VTGVERRDVVAVRLGSVGLRVRRVAEAGVRAPVVEVVDAGGLQVDLTVEIGPLPDRWRYTAVFLRVGVEDHRVQAIDLSSRTPSPTVISGIGNSTFGWFFGDFSDGVLDVSPIRAIAVLDVPDHLDTLALRVRLEASVRRPVLRCFPGRTLQHVRAAQPWRLTVPLPPDRPSRAPAPGLTAVGGSAVRLCLASDIENYSRFRNPEAARAQQRFRELLARTRELAGIDESAVRVQDAGDGQFAVLPSGLDETVVIPRLVAGLATALRNANSDLNEYARLRIRVALHRGTISASANGWVGTSAIAVHRMLDSQPLRQALAEAPVADFALMVPDYLYRDVIAHGYGDLVPDTFRPTTVNMPDKGFTERAWIHVPSSDTGPS
jgi:hypothetical protein